MQRLMEAHRASRPRPAQGFGVVLLNLYGIFCLIASFYSHIADRNDSLSALFSSY